MTTPLPPRPPRAARPPATRAAVGRSPAPVLALALALAAGCAGDKPAAQPDASPYAKSPPAATDDLRGLTDSLDARTAERRPVAARVRPRADPQIFEPPADTAQAPAPADAPAPSPAADASAATATSTAIPATTPVPAALTPPTPPEPPERRRERLVRELAGTLSEQPRPASALDQPLRALLLAAGSVGPDDQAAAARLLDEQAATLRPAPGLTITRATLARRVTGFGQFTPFPSSTFLVGRAQTALVYVEVDRFGHREITGQDGPLPTAPDPAGEQWAVELAQELQLYHDADGVLVWRSPEQPTRDLSTRQRRDHYLVQRIELPARLTVGAYRLKVIVRDRVTDATAEAAIPIEVVADAALVNPG